MAVLTLLISIWNAFATQRVVDVIPYLTKAVTDADDPLMLMMEEVLFERTFLLVGYGYFWCGPTRFLLSNYLSWRRSGCL